MNSSVALRPVRFTDHLEPMREFLETLGLRPRIESNRGGWVDMVAGSGMAALHDAASSASGGRPGETRLSFEADDVDALAERLKAGGYDDATVWDEAYGRVLSVTAPGGGQIWVDERSDDLYGYQLHRAKPDPRITVAPILYVEEPGIWRPFLETIGGAASDPVRVQPASDDPGIVAGPMSVQLGLLIAEPIERLAERLAVAPVGDQLELTDPDGQPVLVRSIR